MEIAEMEFDQLVRALAELKQAALREPELWARFDELADERARGESYKHIDPETEYYAHRMIVHPNPRVDWDKLSELMNRQQWILVTEQVRQPSMEKLTEAVAKNQIPKDLVDKAMVQPEDQIRHRCDRASAKDLAGVK